jgi:hypothetical protein
MSVASVTSIFRLKVDAFNVSTASLRTKAAAVKSELIEEQQCACVRTAWIHFRKEIFTDARSADAGSVSVIAEPLKEESVEMKALAGRHVFGSVQAAPLAGVTRRLYLAQASAVHFDGPPFASSSSGACARDRSSAARLLQAAGT